ncbi:MAG: ArsA family ATPase [Myxococcota bacterium]|nr:ArsA family ATPase [Myxococcota bacterium]
MSFLNRRVVLVSGKGGVGRTALAAALGKYAAQQGRRVLLTEVTHAEEGQSALADYFDVDHVQARPREIEPGLHLCHLWARTGHEQFLTSVLPSRTLIRAALRSRAVERFLVAAPSFHEMGVFYHLLSLLTERDRHGAVKYDYVVIDMPATGHALALTGLPDILLRLMPAGPVAQALKKGQAIFNDAATTCAWIVTLPEQLPVTESLELVAGFERTHVAVGGLFLNRCLDDPFTSNEIERLTPYVEAHRLFGALSLKRLKAATQARARLASGTQLPIINVPHFDCDTHMALLDRLVEHLAEGEHAAV